MASEACAMHNYEFYSASFPLQEEKMELHSYAHKVGVNIQHLEWCTKYRYKMMKQEKYKKLCEDGSV